MNSLSNFSIEELKAIPLKELLAFQKQLTVAIEERKQMEKKEVMEKIQALVSESGFSMEEVLSKKAKKKAVAKYRHPENSQETWVGLGRKPQWLQTLLDQGADLEDFKI